MSFLFGKPKPPAVTIPPQLQPILDLQKQVAQFGMTQAQPAIEKATGAYDTSLDFFKTMMSGSSEDIMKLFNAQDYTRSADVSEATAQELGGRTGARAAVVGQSTEDRAANLNKILEQIRVNAPGQIAQIGQSFSNLGTGMLSAAMGGGAQASNIIFGQQELASQALDRRNQLISSIIGTAGGVLGAYLGR